MAAGGVVAAAAIAKAIKASGVVIRLRPEEFTKVLARTKDPLVVIAEGGLFSRNYQYLISYKGLAFFTKSSAALELPAGAEIVAANDMWMNG